MNEVFAALKSQSAVQNSRLVDADITPANANSVVLVDVRDRENFAPRITYVKTLNIPLDELSARASELSSLGKHVVIDCTPMPTKLCERARDHLSAHGVAYVAVLNEGASSESICAPR